MNPTPTATSLTKSLELMVLGPQEPVAATRLKEQVLKEEAPSTLDLTLDLDSSFHLNWIAQHPTLRSVAVRVIKLSIHCGITPFCAGPSLPPLTRLTLHGARLYGDFISPLSSLPLEFLSLEGCSFANLPNITALENCPTLSQFNIKRVEYPSGRAAAFLRGIYILEKAHPRLAVEADKKIADFTAYQNVLTDTAGRYRYHLKDRELPPYRELGELLDNVGPDEDSHWDFFWGKTLSHNSCTNYKWASPINCPDGRPRFAAELPNYSDEDFWTFLSNENIGLIATVMHRHPWEDEIPQEVGGSLTAGLFTIKCTECIDHPLHGITQRALDVNGKSVHHLQINWYDNEGMEMESLVFFMKLFFECEAETPDAKSLAHCFSGYGRTGTFFGCLIVALLLKKQEKIDPELLLDLEALIRGLRQQRGCMINTEAQLETIFKYAKTAALQ